MEEPGVPVVVRNLILEYNERLQNYSYQVFKRQIMTNAKVEAPFIPTPTNKIPDKHINFNYVNKVYPDTICSLRSVIDVDGCQLLRFFVSPFEYDATNSSLYFVDSIRVNVNFEICNDTEIKRISRLKNSGFFNRAQKGRSFDPTILDSVDVEPSVVLSPIEYLIITSESLKNAFKPLAEWKRLKGVPSKIITVEEIYSTFSGNTPQLKIKKCIKYYCDTYGTYYFLLGGDNNVVPSQGLSVTTGIFEKDANGNSIGLYKDHNIPSDIFYSSLHEPLDWDTNGDGKSGTIYVDFDLFPTVCVTRAPVLSFVDAEIFANRTIEYEKHPIYNQNFLLAGSALQTVSTL